MAIYFKKAEEVANKVIKSFQEGTFAKAMGQVFINGVYERHMSKYSTMNKLIVILNGYSDAMGYKQWSKIERNVKKGEKAIQILAPVIKKIRDKETDEEKTICIGFRAINVFGYEQTEGKPIAYDEMPYFNDLPFKEVADKWGIKVTAYNGNEEKALGMYSPVANTITLGTRNLSTWVHELVHAAEDRLGYLNNKSKREKVISEVSAEFTGAVLLSMIGKEKEADIGGAFEYIKAWAAEENLKVIDICTSIIKRISTTIEFIMEESNIAAEEVAA